MKLLVLQRSLFALAFSFFSTSGCTKAETPAADPATTRAGAAASAPASAPAGGEKDAPVSALRDPARATTQAPDAFTVKLATTKGDILIDVKREWAPLGADRFYNLVKAGYYEDVAFFRVIGGFMAQAGISGDPELNAIWREARIPDDPVKASNLPGYVTFATGGPNTRTTQFFINFVDNHRLDSMGFAPFGKVRDESMDVVNKLYAGYGEGAPRGKGPSQGRIQTEGNAYLKKEFPELDYIERATVVED